jgi:hypothetical protein
MVDMVPVEAVDVVLSSQNLKVSGSGNLSSGFDDDAFDRLSSLVSVALFRRACGPGDLLTLRTILVMDLEMLGRPNLRPRFSSLLFFREGSDRDAVVSMIEEPAMQYGSEFDRTGLVDDTRMTEVRVVAVGCLMTDDDEDTTVDGSEGCISSELHRLSFFGSSSPSAGFRSC